MKPSNGLHPLRIRFIIALLSLPCAIGNAQHTLISDMDLLRWEKVMLGVWKASFGEIGLNPRDYAGAPNIEAIKALGDGLFPFAEKSTYSLLSPGRASIRLPLDATEKIYGLGLEFEGMNRRSNVYSLKVDHYGGTKGYTHAPVPFYISNRGYGVLINSPRRVKIHVGIGNRKDSQKPAPIDRTTGTNWSARPLSDAIEASVQGGGMEIFVFIGQTPLEVVQRYNLFHGGGVIPPKWGLGFWHRMHTQSSDKDVLQEIEDFQAHDFPLDVIGLEPGWQSFAYPCSFDWDSTRFPDPKAFVQTLDKKGIKVNLWENPYVAPTSSMYDEMRHFTGSHTVWLGEVPDYTLPDAQAVLLRHHQKNHLHIGVSGYKIDEVDGYDFWLWPDHAIFPSGHDAVEIRQLYGLIIQSMLDVHFRQQNRRTYGLVRSSYIGATNLNFVLYSDYYDHEGYVTALANASLSGLLWTPEIRSAKSGEEWIRRFQSVCFSPLMMLNAWASGTKPWSFPEVTDMVRNNIELRQKLLPYIYTAFYNYHKVGIPPFRAMVLEDSHAVPDEMAPASMDDVDNPFSEEQRIEVTDQFMMGPSILVAPVFAGQDERTIVLPRGNWFDFYTGTFMGNGEIIKIKSKLEEIPLLVKDGAIIPMLSSLEKTANTPPLEVRHYGTKENTFNLYNDDGVSFDYAKGDFSITQLVAKQGTDGKFKGTSSQLTNDEYTYGPIVWRWMTVE
ncbi:MAG: glycoside hydrolase family 31 protein [Saprospiraceae bacterium]|nr:glycoside hydrolase family 31 protein [Saprospiraceae bacterium]